MTTLFGLPETVQFCTRCVMSNQRPASSVEFENAPGSPKVGLALDEHGVCDACRVAEMKERDVDWAERHFELGQLCKKYRSRNGSYDCIVPGSGGKDSVYASHTLKTKYDMHPLTVTWSPHLYTDVGWSNFVGWIHNAGFDNYLFTPNGQTHRALTRLAYRNLLHPFQPFILGQKNFAPRMAIRFGIPLVLYGEPESEYGNPRAETATSNRALKYYAHDGTSNRRIFLGGVPLDELPAHGVSLADVDPYLPVDIDSLRKAFIDVRYLGFYVRWVPQEAYYYAVEHSGFRPNDQRTEGTYSKYNSIDDKTDPYHYWTTYIKFGLGRASYDAAQEIRNGHLTRAEGVNLVHRYDGEFPRRYLKDFLEYLDMDEAELHEIADHFRPPHLWEKIGNDWKLRHVVK